jgi:hypothetical protein
MQEQDAQYNLQRDIYKEHQETPGIDDIAWGKKISFFKMGCGY